MRLKNWIPAAFRLSFRLFQRFSSDFFKKRSFAKNIGAAPELPFYIQVEQPIFKSFLFENKIHNIQISLERIEQLTILPKEIFSFWKALGAPTAQNGYREGRNLVGGVLTKSMGGGLCQLSGILYHLSLFADVEIVERHHHSMDIYTETERYSPLGADATVVYGYKDFRFTNNFAFPICFRFELSDNKLIAKLCAASEIQPQTIHFIRTEGEKTTTVRTLDGEGLVKAVSVYKNVV